MLDVLRRGAMSDLDVSREFEAEYAAWQGSRYALAHSNGTAALQAAMYACQVGVGDEIICPSITYWASALPAFGLGATIVFADILPDTLGIDPADIEHRITDRTKAIVVVHYLGYPVDMDPVLEIARRRGVKVIEDVSHAHGARYKGRPVGIIGDAGAASMMTGKSLPSGEGGMLTTNNRELYERAIAFGHYERYGATPVTIKIETEDLLPHRGLPLGGVKNRMHQMSAAVGRVQLKALPPADGGDRPGDERLLGPAGGRARPAGPPPPAGSDTTMGGWYAPHGLYRPEALGGLSVTRFAAPCGRGRALHRRGERPPAPAPAAEHGGRLRARPADAPGEHDPGRAPAGRLPAGERSDQRAHLPHPLVQALPPRADRGARPGLPQGGRERRGAAGGRSGGPATSERLANLYCSAVRSRK